MNIKEIRGKRYAFRDDAMGRTYDHLPSGTHLNERDSNGNALGVALGGRFRTQDVNTQDGYRTYDSTGAFMVGELERLDPRMHEPLASVSWGRDIDLREDVTIADEISSFTLSTFGSAGSLGAGNGIGNGKAWIGKDTNQMTGVGLDISKTVHSLRPWGMELKYTILELESAAKLGRPIDAQKFQGLQLKHQMDIDEQVYIGDTSLGDTGLVNNSAVTATNVPNGVSGFSTWNKKTPTEILNDVNTMLTTTWQNSAWAVLPERLLIPPAQFGFLASNIVSTAGSISILKFIQDNSILTTSGMGKLQIYPTKWCIGAGVGGTIGTTGTVDRAVVYTKDQKRVRYPMTLLQRTPIQFDSVYHKTTYYCRLGQVEVVYPETMSYWDGI